MAQDGIRSTRQDRTNPPALDWDHAVAEGIRASVEPMETSEALPMPNRMLSQPQFL